MSERDDQEQEFFADHQHDILRVAKAFHWNPKGSEYYEWVTHLLPDGYECPEDETYAELDNSLSYFLEQLDTEEEDPCPS